jgi:L-fucose isomerase-like protein
MKNTLREAALETRQSVKQTGGSYESILELVRGHMTTNHAEVLASCLTSPSAADTSLHAYIAEGEILPVGTRSFGGIGIFAIPEMKRFYRYVLIAKRYPHHGAVAFGHYGKALYTLLDYLGVEDIEFNRPKSILYKNENPFA